MKDQYKISVVVCVYNRENFIKNCIESLRQQSVDDYEIIIVDDGSTDATHQILEKYDDGKIRIYHNSHCRGLSYSRNRGISESRGEYIALTDSDCVVAADWLENLIAPFASDPAVMIVGGRIEDPPFGSYWQRVNNGSNFIASKSGCVQTVIGCNMALRKSFWETEKFDENLFYPAADDFDLCLRCAKKGHKVYYQSRANVKHYHRSTWRETFWQHFRYGFFNAKIGLKNKKVDFFAPYIFVGIVLVPLAIAALMKGSLPLGLWTLSVFLVSYALACFFLNFKRRDGALGETCITFPGFVFLSFSHSLGKMYYFLRNLLFMKDNKNG